MALRTGKVFGAFEKQPPLHVLMFVSFPVLFSKTRVFSRTFHACSRSFPVSSLSIIFSNFYLG